MTIVVCVKGLTCTSRSYFAPFSIHLAPLLAETNEPAIKYSGEIQRIRIHVYSAAVERKTLTICARLWSPYGIGQTIYILMLWFVFLLLLFFFPRLISAVADWMSAILPHMVWP